MKKLTDWCGRAALLGLALTGFLYLVLPPGFAAFTLPGATGPSLGDANVNPYTLGKAINEFNQQQTSATLTASTTGVQATATQLVSGLNVIGTAGAGNTDSVQLPSCNIGAVVYVTNNGTGSAVVFGKNGRTDVINATAGATGLAQAAGAHTLYICAAPGATSGTWTTIRASS